MDKRKEKKSEGELPGIEEHRQKRSEYLTRLREHQERNRKFPLPKKEETDEHS